MIPCAIIAGGRSLRLGGGEKCLGDLGGRTILDHVIAALAPQTGALLINSNSDPELFARTGLPVRADILPGRLGPLAGIHTAMVWARDLGAQAVLTTPADTPFLPRDLVEKLAALRAPGEAAIAASEGEIHPVIGLWPCAMAAALKTHLSTSAYRVRGWLGQIDYRQVEFSGAGIDPFWNINTPADLAHARAALTRP